VHEALTAFRRTPPPGRRRRTGFVADSQSVPPGGYVRLLKETVSGECLAQLRAGNPCVTGGCCVSCLCCRHQIAAARPGRGDLWKVLLIDMGALAMFLAYMAIVYWHGVSAEAQPPGHPVH